VESLRRLSQVRGLELVLVQELVQKQLFAAERAPLSRRYRRR
jgi:hypothetical protein